MLNIRHGTAKNKSKNTKKKNKNRKNTEDDDDGKTEEREVGVYTTWYSRQVTHPVSQA